MQAFLGIRQVEKASWAANNRNKNHIAYAKRLEGHVSFQKWNNDFPVSISFGALAESNSHRREIVNRLVNEGVETRIFSAGNLGLHPFWVDLYGAYNDEVSDNIHSRGFFLPNYPELTEEEIDIICDVVKG